MTSEDKVTKKENNLMAENKELRNLGLKKVDEDKLILLYENGFGINYLKRYLLNIPNFVNKKTNNLTPQGVNTIVTIIDICNKKKENKKTQSYYLYFISILFLSYFYIFAA